MTESRCPVCGSNNVEFVVGGYPSKGRRLICKDREKNPKLHDQIDNLMEQIRETTSPSLKKIMEEDLKKLRKELGEID